MQDEAQLTLRRRRERALTDLSQVIQEVYGPRCGRHMAGCLGCSAWTIFDLVDKWTDTDIIEMIDEKEIRQDA